MGVCDLYIQISFCAAGTLIPTRHDQKTIRTEQKMALNPEGIMALKFDERYLSIMIIYHFSLAVM